MQVTNTPWAERVTFLFAPGLDQVAKPLHVSPFMVSLLSNLHQLHIRRIIVVEVAATQLLAF